MAARHAHGDALGATRHVNVRSRASSDHSASYFFDCETTGITDDCSITCAAVTSGNGVHSYVWHSGQGECLSVAAGNALVDFLIECGPEKLYTFNGAAFDLKVLYRLTNRAELKNIALNHHDLMMTFVCENRYYSSMDSFAKPTLGSAQSKTNTGAWAATAWFADDAEAVIEYCVADTAVLAQLVSHVSKWGKLRRTSKSGRVMTWLLDSLNGSVPTVAESLKAPASAAWMTEPPALPDVAWTAATCQ